MLHIKVPIVLYGDNSRKPLEDRWTRYSVDFAGHRFLDFRFLAVHPSSLPVRDFLHSHNPVQLALAARMDLGEGDLVRIKLDLLRQMAKLPMRESQLEQAVRYLEAYLEEEDSEAFQRELALLAQQEHREAGMGTFIDYFTKIGMEKGREDGLQRGLEQGLRQNALDNARKMLAEGFDWNVVTRITGLRPEDLEG